MMVSEVNHCRETGADSAGRLRARISGTLRIAPNLTR